MKTLILGALALTVAALPAASFAQMYAYVNTSGEVMSIDAATPETAIATAPGIGVHSGVIRLDDTSDTELLGDNVSGV